VYHHDFDSPVSEEAEAIIENFCSRYPGAWIQSTGVLYVTGERDLVLEFPALQYPSNESLTFLNKLLMKHLKYVNMTEIVDKNDDIFDGNLYF
jgi:hypothetical protein